MEDVKKDNSKMSKRIITIFAWLITGLLSLMVILLLVFGLSSIKQGKMVKIFGYSYSVIVSESMVPTINVSDIIIINTKYEFEDVKKDDIIVFYNPNEQKNIAHRVVDILDDGSLQTCGDNNNGLVDGFHVTEEYYIGKVTKYGHFLGLGSLMMNGRVVFFIALAAIFMYIIVTEAINIYKMSMKKKHEDKMKEIEDNKKKQEDELRAQLKAELLKELENEKNKLS